MGVRVRPQIRSEGFKQFVRGYPCLIAGINGHACDGKIQFAHVRKGNDGGLGVKPSDCHGVPMCDRAHIRIQHQHGEPAFEREFALSQCRGRPLLGRVAEDGSGAKVHALSCRHVVPDQIDERRSAQKRGRHDDDTGEVAEECVYPNPENG